MLTAARAASSPARISSSCPKASGVRLRTKKATPSVVPRAASGTVITEWTPNARARAARAGSCASHPAIAASVTACTAGRPVRRLSKGADPSG